MITVCITQNVPTFKLLINNDDLPLQRAIFALVFEDTPTYLEIANGTAKLSFIFKLSKVFNRSKSGLVDETGFSWNQLKEIYMRWRTVFSSEKIKRLRKKSIRDRPAYT